LSTRDGGFGVVRSEVRVNGPIGVERLDVLVCRMIGGDLVEASLGRILQLDDPSVHCRLHEILCRRLEADRTVRPEKEGAVVDDSFLQAANHQRIVPVCRLHVGKWYVCTAVATVTHLAEEVHCDFEPLGIGDDVSLMKTSVVLAVDCAFSVEILRGTTDSEREVLVIREDVVLVGIATRDERAVRERSTGNRLEAGNRKNRSVIELLIGKFAECIAGFLGLVRQLESLVLALGIVDVLADGAHGNEVAVGEKHGDRLAGTAFLELEVEMESLGGTGTPDFSEDQPLANSIALVDSDGIVLHVCVARAEVVAMINDHAIAPRSAPAGLLHGTFSSSEDGLALILVAGQAEIPAVLAVIASGMTPRADVVVRAVVLAVALVVADLAVTRPRLGDFPVVLGVERNLEAGRTAAAVVHGIEIVALIRGVVDDLIDRVVVVVGVLHLLVVGTVSAVVVVVDFRGLARRSERDDRGHDDQKTVTHDRLLLSLHFFVSMDRPRKSFQINQIKLNQDVKEHLVNSSFFRTFTGIESIRRNAGNQRRSAHLPAKSNIYKINPKQKNQRNKIL